VKLSIEAPPTAWVRELKGIEGIYVEVLDCTLHEDGSIMHLINVTTPDRKTAEHVKQIIKSSKFVEESFFVEGTATSVIGYVKTRRCTLCGIFANRCLVRKSAYDIRKNRIVWRFFANGRDIPCIINELESKGVGVELLESVEAKSLLPKGVSAHLLMNALDEGYFDVPRRVTTHELARRLNKTPAALSITLRRSVKKILKNYVHINAVLA